MSENLTKTVVEKFSDMRAREKMTLAQAGEKINCSRSHLSNVLSYRDKPSEKLAVSMFTVVCQNQKNHPYPICKNR